MSVILVVDDSIEVRLSLSMLLSDNGYEVIEADNPQVAQMMLKKHDVQLILMDMNYTRDTTSGQEGLDFLRWLQGTDEKITTVAMTAWSNVELAVKAMQLGCQDFIEKPWKNKRVLQVVEHQLAFRDLQLENDKLKQQLSDKSSTQYQWRSDCMVTLMEQIETVAQTDANVLLTGQNGTGKSALAAKIHQLSTRADNAFIAVNMGGISETLFESELFGHKKGAFTDAKSNRIGRFELAESGSLFLDEVANIPLSQQAKLLRVLESGEYEVLGSSHTKRTNLRIIAATNGDIAQLIDKEQFREDLYYRLNTIEFLVPPLNQRLQDIVPLARQFIAKFSEKYGREPSKLSENACNALLNYHWPGNVRELSHLIERAVLLSKGAKIEANDFNMVTAKSNGGIDLMTLEQAEIELIKLAMSKARDNVPKAAQLLGLTKSSMYRRLEKYESVQS